MNKSLEPYDDKGVELSDHKIYAGDKSTLNYRGILALSGADRIFTHYGYGDLWNEKEYIEMSRRDGMFTAEIDLKMPGTLNVCFKDSAGNWDNNSYENYSFKVLAKKITRKSKKAILAD